MLVFFKRKLITLNWLDTIMSNQFFLNFVNALEGNEFVKIPILHTVKRLDSQRNYFSDGSYRTVVDIELVLVLATDINIIIGTLGTTFLFINDNAYLFENISINNIYTNTNMNTDRIYSTIMMTATNFIILNENQKKVITNFFETEKIDTSLLQFDSITNFFEK
jgi:hypothetical protein